MILGNKFKIISYLLPKTKYEVVLTLFQQGWTEAGSHTSRFLKLGPSDIWSQMILLENAFCLVGYLAAFLACITAVTLTSASGSVVGGFIFSQRRFSVGTRLTPTQGYRKRGLDFSLPS